MQPKLVVPSVLQLLRADVLPNRRFVPTHGRHEVPPPGREVLPDEVPRPSRELPRDVNRALPLDVPDDLERLTRGVSRGVSPFNSRYCQTLDAAPAKPGGLPRLR